MPTTILIVEDEAIVARDLARTLAGFGYEVAGTAATGEDAIRRCAERCPDLALMDVRLPGAWDGVQTAAVLRERFRVPVVYLTAHADDETLARARATEPGAFLVKPFHPRELKAALEIATYRHEMSVRLGQTERWLSATLRSISDGVVAVDGRGRVSFMNLVAEKLTGWSAEDAVGRPFVELMARIDPRTGQPAANPLEQALREASVHEPGQPLAWRTSAGAATPIQERVAPIVDETGTAVGAVMVFRDLAERRGVEAQLAQSDRLASLGTLAAGVSHELGGPVSCVSGNLELALETLDRLAHDPATADAIGPLRRQLAESLAGVSQIARIAQDLGRFGRPAAASEGAIPVAPCLEWALRTTESRVQERARLVGSISEAPPVRAQPGRLEQILVDLLSHAAQAIPPGDPHRNRVEVALRGRPDGWVEITVRDSGPGLADEVRDRIFTPFAPGRPPAAEASLGLAAVHGIVVSLEGRIEVDTAPDKGTTVRVLLPAAGDGPRPEARRAASGPTLTRRGRILVIDDEPMLAELMGRLLAGRHEVRVETAAKSALARLTAGEDFDLVLCDLLMPGTSGVELHRRLLAERPAMARRMAFMTGGAYTAEAIAFLGSVPNRQLAKPFDYRTLEDFVQESMAALGTGTGTGAAGPRVFP